jgi:hypothetical protein
MNKLLLSLLLLISFSGYSQDCKVCNYSFFGIPYSINISNGDCPQRRFSRLVSSDDSRCIVLPIELNYLTVDNSNDFNIITFETVTEINNDYFTIEHSTDGTYWDIIEYVTGSGNSNLPIKYAVEHNNYINGDNYYRLTQYDYNGVYEVFDIITIENVKIEKILMCIYNAKGEIVDENYNGIKVYKYSDGSFKRILQIR